ncbi:MAG: lytic transglycosylase domain-containing protein [Aeromonas sp.]
MQENLAEPSAAQTALTPVALTASAPPSSATAPPRPATRLNQVRVYKSVGKNGVVRYGDAPPRQGHYELLRFNDCFACNVQSQVNWRTTGLYLTPYSHTIAQAAANYQVEPALIRALIHAESAFNPRAVSRKGAMGLTQLMPATARELGVSDALHAEQNILGGVKYLASLLRRYDGDVALAMAAYNAGMGAVQKHGGVPPYPETRAYVARVQTLYARYQQHLRSALAL